MRYLVRTETGLVATFAVAMLVAYVGLAVAISGEQRFAGVMVLLCGLWAMIYVPVTHDREHRFNGEATHALWGRGDRWKPSWWNNW